jgi:hypothetical protein
MSDKIERAEQRAAIAERIRLRCSRTFKDMPKCEWPYCECLTIPIEEMAREK